MSVKYKKTNTIRVLQETKVNEATFVKRGYVLYSEPIFKHRILLEGTPNLAVGGVYSHGNLSRSFVNLSNIGTFHGNFTLENVPNIETTDHNYLTSLIPGQYPPISGPWSETQNYYNLQSILDYTNENENRYFCKILGMGLGDINNYRVADVCRNSLSSLSQNFINDVRIVGVGDFSRFGNKLSQVSWSNVLDGYEEPLTLVGENYYMSGFNWPSRYGISVMNGGNTFPTMGWAGARVGFIKPVTSYYQNNILFNFPSMYLELAKENNPVGIIYPGQGVQITSFPRRSLDNIPTFDKRNIRTFQDTINNRVNEKRYSGIQPYQQGRGIYELVQTNANYDREDDGVIDSTELAAVYGATGVQPGRNNAFMGVTLSDYWSESINFNNLESGSKTPKDTRYDVPDVKQTNTAHNAPMVYTSTDENNTSNPLPWNSLFGYIGTTSSSSSNIRSQNTPILTDGVTTMVVSGAFPLYRGTHPHEFSGLGFTLASRWTGVSHNQYYLSEEFWNPNFNDPTTPEISNSNLPVPPNPPYRLKGGVIILYEGQKVNAGSYVYSSMNMVGNVNISQFYGPAAKDISLIGGERNQLIGDVHSKYQSNQGGLIVMVNIDGEEPPLPPSCCQPVGIILEDVIGFGNPTYTDNQILLEGQTNKSTAVQTVPEDILQTKQIQGREILVKLFPMYPNIALSGFPRQYVYNFTNTISYPSTTPIFYTPLGPGNALYTLQENSGMYQKIRTSFMLFNNPSAYQSTAYASLIQFVPDSSPFFGISLKTKEFLNDWPAPEFEGLPF